MSLTRRSGVRIPLFLAVLVSALCLPLAAQTAPGSAAAALQPIPQANRVPAQANFTQQTQLTGHLPGWVTSDHQAAAAVDLSAPMHISIVLRRDPTVQAAFEKLLANQQNPASPLYHHWLTPQQIGDLYGPTSSDVAAVTGWLGAQGLSVDSVAPSRVILSVSGSTAKVASAFRTSFAYFNLAGKQRFSATTEPFIPSALVPVINSIHGLTEVPLEPHSHGTAAKRPVSSSGAPHPQLTITNNGVTSYFVTPNDFAVIYDIQSVYSGGNTGATIGSKAQHIAIVGLSRVVATDISEYESTTGLPSVQPNVKIPTTGVDPGITNNGDQDEATLDVDRVIGTAPGAVPDLIVSTQASGGIALDAEYNVDTLLDPIMTISFGNCELNAGTNDVKYWDSLFSTAAGEGISVFVSSDDSGAAGCETGNATPTGTQVLSINSICSSTYATCVGGTEFNDTSNPSKYWSTTNSSTGESALSYIPEGGWNEPTTTNSSNQTIYIDSASGGGVSTIITKPTWQTGTGVPNDGYRDVPDVALSASSHDGYYACLAYAGGDCSNGYFEYFSGTSASAPGMAGITALLNTKAGSSQGNLNPLLYKLAASTPGAFHDATVSTSGVTGCTKATPSMCNNSTPSATGLTGGLAGYLLTTGYDQVTGLGSLDVANFLTAAATTSAATFTVTPATTAISLVSGATTGNTDTITLASVNSFAGAVALTCTATNASGTAAGTCSLAPTSATLASGGTGTSVLTINTTASTSGSLDVTVTGTNGTTVITSSTIVVTVTAPPTAAFTFSTPSPLSFTSGATTGNSDTLTLTSTNSFAGSVALTCSITTSSAAFQPTCSAAPTSVSLTAGGTNTSTIAIGSTTAQANATSVQAKLERHWGLSGGAFLAMLLFVPSLRRRKALRSLAAFAVMLVGLAALSGCGGGSTSTSKSSAGTYTVTVTGIGTSAGTTTASTASTTFTVTIN